MENANEFLQLETEIVKVLKNIYDPEIPVNIYDLGLIYEVTTDKDKNVCIKMTLTAPNCPLADSLIEEINKKVINIKGVKNLNINLVFNPPWDKNMMSESAKLDLGFL